MCKICREGSFNSRLGRSWTMLCFFSTWGEQRKWKMAGTLICNRAHSDCVCTWVFHIRVMFIYVWGVSSCHKNSEFCPVFVTRAGRLLGERMLRNVWIENLEEIGENVKVRGDQHSITNPVKLVMFSKPSFLGYWSLFSIHFRLKLNHGLGILHFKVSATN